MKGSIWQVVKQEQSRGKKQLAAQNAKHKHVGRWTSGPSRARVEELIRFRAADLLRTEELDPSAAATRAICEWEARFLTARAADRFHVETMDAAVRIAAERRAHCESHSVRTPATVQQLEAMLREIDDLPEPRSGLVRKQIQTRAAAWATVRAL